MQRTISVLEKRIERALLDIRNGAVVIEPKRASKTGKKRATILPKT
jgi:hypothetical protein